MARKISIQISFDNILLVAGLIISFIAFMYSIMNYMSEQVELHRIMGTQEVMKVTRSLNG